MYAGIAFENGGTHGVELNDTGFTVTNNSVVAKGSCPRLNNLSTPYRYVAFK